MRRFLCLALALLCLTAAGCQSVQTDPETTAAPTAGETTAPTEDTLSWTEVTNPGVTIPRVTESTGSNGSTLAFSNHGKLRIPYEGNRSSVKYITSPGELPDYPEFDGYDEAFFESHALLVVTDTATSGAVQVEIGFLTVDGTDAVVTLVRQMQGDAGTADMATWLLWAEVEQGLDYDWTVANPGIQPEGEKY